jgi:hypothetical protein
METAAQQSGRETVKLAVDNRVPDGYRREPALLLYLEEQRKDAGSAFLF